MAVISLERVALFETVSESVGDSDTLFVSWLEIVSVVDGEVVIVSDR